MVQGRALFWKEKGSTVRCTYRYTNTQMVRGTNCDVNGAWKCCQSNAKRRSMLQSVRSNYWSFLFKFSHKLSISLISSHIISTLLSLSLAAELIRNIRVSPVAATALRTSNVALIFKSQLWNLFDRLSGHVYKRKGCNVIQLTSNWNHLRAHTDTHTHVWQTVVEH